MDPISGRVRRPTAQEIDEIRLVIPEFAGYRISSPCMILEVEDAPKFAPMTIGGLPIIYADDMFKVNESWGIPGNPEIDDFGA